MTYSQLTYPTYRQPAVVITTKPVSTWWAKNKATIGDIAAAALIFTAPMLLLFI